MKAFFLVLTIFFYANVNATTYYISPSGNDATGTGTSTNPWKTLYKATSTVSAVGDIIHVNAGTYTETIQCALKVGVSIEGEGVTSILKSSLTADWTEMLSLRSAEGTSGNQHVSNLKFDGQNATTYWAILIGGRSNVSVHDITVVDFKDRGVIFGGRNDNVEGAPSIYATGNTCYNNIITNCAQYERTQSYGTGCLNIGGQDGMLIYNNTISQTTRAEGYNGWPIKYYNGGYVRGCKIYNNVLNKAPLHNPVGVNNWDFAIELFNEQGLEIYGNTIVNGGIDCNYQTKGTYAYSVWIHDNNISMTTAGNYLQHAVTLEFNTQYAIVENNIMDKQNTGVLFTPRNGDAVDHITIRRNLITNMHIGEGSGFFVMLGGEGQTNNFNTIDIYNNTMVQDPTAPSPWGIKMPNPSAGSIKNIRIRNNTIMNSAAGAIVQPAGSIVMDSINIDNNNIFGNGGSNNPVWNGATPTHYTNNNNLKVTPLFVGGNNYTLQAASTLINAGMNVGLTFNGSAPDIGYAETGNASTNIPPTASAGADQAITLPISIVTLNGSGTDTDGTIASYQWTKISGPIAVMVTPGLASTLVTTLGQGVYKFELKVTDNGGASATDTVQVSVNPGANVAPTANAGADQTITLPTNSISLSGAGTDTDGIIAAYAWSKISGPSAGTITSAATAATSVTGLVQGTYKFLLQVTDNSGATGNDTIQVTVNPAANVAPTANAGADQTITLPTNSISLSGAGTDTDGTIASYAWTKISGPSAGNITSAATAATSVTGLVQGTYKFQLQVTDNSGATGKDTVQITVNPAGNIAPTANAGADQTITLPTNSVSLSGAGIDTDGTIASYAWTKVSGPSAGTITSAATAATSVTGLVQGTYKFQLLVTDNSGATGKDTVQITVNPAGNVAPTANAGANQTITLPINSVSLSGSGTDVDGTIASYAWSKISGPSAGTITSAATAATSVTGLTQGTYTFQLQVTDNSGASGTATMQVIVNPTANIPPTANAGTDITITLPTNSVSLNGSGADVDGTIASYAWTKTSGPATGTITSAATAATTVTGLTVGVYQFQLKVTDNSGASGTATVQVTVNPAPNVPPTANAGSDISITLPVNYATLNGSGADVDGTIASYSWTKISGPTAGTIASAATASSAVTGLTVGVYQFQLQVTDNSGATAVASVQVTVNPAPNVPPTANAGGDISITIPVNTVTLAGSGTDPDGTIVAYSWTRISGPAAGTITNATNATTTVTGLIAGIYKYQLTVTDNSGATATDVMQVVVFAPNIPPTADAGLDQSITLPTNTANLTGNGTDVDGTIVSYKWVKISGPAAGTIANANSAVTTVSGLTAGVYQFQLQVTDNNGASATNTMQVTVNPENIPPVANAGADQTITLPVNTVTLTGSGTDVDGTIISYRWKLLSGPADKLTSPNSAVTVLNDLGQGVYQFELTVTDDKGASAADVVVVTVNAAVPPPTNNTVKIYPNPVVDYTTVEINNTTNNSTVLLMVTDVQGRVVYTKKLTLAGYNAKERLDMRNFAKGAYFVTVNFDSQNRQTLQAIKAN